MWNNNRDPRSDEWIPEFNNPESRVPIFSHSNPMGDRLMKFRLEEFPQSPYKGREPSGNSRQENELNRKLWIDRELQSQAFMSGKFSRSIKGGGNDMGVFHLERSSSGPRSGLFMHNNEDMYSSHEMVHSPRCNYRTSNEPQIGNEFYPVMSNMMEYQQTVANEDYTANTFSSRKGVDSHRKVLDNSMMSYTPSYKNSHMQKFQHKGSTTGSSDYSMQPFAGDYSHPLSRPLSRFQEGPYDHPLPNARFHEGDRLFSSDSYLLQSSSRNDAYIPPVSMHHQRMTLPIVSESEIALGSDSHKCTCCKEHPSSQASFIQHPLVQYPPLAYEQSRNHLYFQEYGNHRQFLSKSSKNSLRSLPVRRKVADPLSEAVQARKKHAPPLPGPCAAPYVVCQGCDKIVQISSHIDFESTVSKIRCSACRRVSIFCNIGHPCYQALLKEGKASISLQQAEGVDSSSKQNSPVPATVATFESNSNVQETMCREEIKAEGQYDGGDKQMEANGSPNNVNGFSSLTAELLQEHAVHGTDGASLIPWSRSGTFHEDSSSLFSVSGSVSTKNTALLKLQESQQLDTNVDHVTSRARNVEAVQAENPNGEIDSTLDQKNDKGTHFSSEDLQGLMLECLQEGFYNGLNVKEKDGSMSHRNQSHQATLQKPECLSVDGNHDLASLSLREQTHCLEHISLLKSNKNSLPETEKTDCNNPDAGKNQAEAFDEGATLTTRGPEAGSPLYEHLSYDSGSEIAEALKVHIQAKETTPVPLSRDISKGSNFLTTFLKKNMQLAIVGQKNDKDSSVVVNGRTISLDNIKVAEQRAGTIRPGVYWYDYEAGFWGVMGGPCLGIIPPFIAEFKMPLTKDCAGGTTDILVNSRELHKKDLDVLAGRGLPRTPSKSYMVDISGQVVDKSSGQMLRSLGRLAPTIQKRGRGCGMFQPPRHS